MGGGVGKKTSIRRDCDYLSGGKADPPLKVGKKTSIRRDCDLEEDDFLLYCGRKEDLN